MPPITTDEDKEIATNFLAGIDAQLPSHVKPVKEEEKKEEKKEEKQEEKKEEELVLQREKKKVTPDESIAALRKARDEERKKNEVFTKIFGDNQPEAIKPLLDYIQEHVEGPMTVDAVTAAIEDLKGTKNKVTELSTELQEKEKKVTELDIRFSDDFKKNYELPYKEAFDTLFLEFATVAEDKTLVAPKSTQAFHALLTSNPEITGLDAKAALMKFAKDYEAESGEKPMLPSMDSLMSSLRKFKVTKATMHDAFTNWQTKKKEDAQRAVAERQIQSEAQKKASKKMRTDLVSKAFREFDLDSIPFVDDKEAEELFKEEYAFGEEIFDGKKVPEYDSVMARGVKARLWDKYSKKLSELLELEKTMEEGERNGLPGSRRIINTKTGEKVDWLGGALK